MVGQPQGDSVSQVMPFVGIGVSHAPGELPTRWLTEPALG
jgi:hypothetical protein